MKKATGLSFFSANAGRFRRFVFSKAPNPKQCGTAVPHQVVLEVVLLTLSTPNYTMIQGNYNRVKKN
ncbi:hypothetical protein GCM10010969_05150 [Saccharibacillus kuerlensis]|uniref:Uncharacterized protein n=1 Tax=Saccharibacillus kuerlensis TaxID=459527 RepID=A0ABQ2KU64_9BACL|nr:hypothetical protein GCM10010969_05150 [Saccharibacillus kuerlensis]